MKVQIDSTLEGKFVIFYNNLLNYNNCNQHLQLKFHELRKCSTM